MSGGTITQALQPGKQRRCPVDSATMPRSAYIHVPFCAHRCGYCDFTLIAGRDDLIGDYLRALRREINGVSFSAMSQTAGCDSERHHHSDSERDGVSLPVLGMNLTNAEPGGLRRPAQGEQRGGQQWEDRKGEELLTLALSPPRRGARGQGEEGDRTAELDTLFFGGGTPTHPSCEQLREMFRIVFERFVLAPGAEVSVEANPLDLTDEKIELLADVGVNRISLGVQSFSTAALALLERDHAPCDIEDVVSRLRRRFDNVSLDLIFGVPGQTLDDWRATLRRAISLGPTHLSTYGLTWEQGTAFGTRRDRGELTPIDEELERDQYALAMSELTAAGFEQYEISNFARTGYRCRHNEVYWAGDEYWAFGPGAARYINGRRETNIRSVLGWLSKLERNESPVADAEELEAAHRARELVFIGLRRTDGIYREDFQRRTGFVLDDIAATTIQANVRRGWLEDLGDRIRLSSEGRFVADRVVAEFL
jgi:oxygen-independent coproporphyrinogen III oxidase